MREEVNGRCIVKITSSGLTLLDQRKLLHGVQQGAATVTAALEGQWTSGRLEE